MSFLSIASKAAPIFRTAWSFIKSSPFLKSVGSAVVGHFINKGVDMIDEKTKSNQNQLVTSIWDITKNNAKRNPNIPGNIKKHIMRKKV